MIRPITNVDITLNKIGCCSPCGKSKSVAFGSSNQAKPSTKEVSGSNSLSSTGFAGNATSNKLLQTRAAGIKAGLTGSKLNLFV